MIGLFASALAAPLTLQEVLVSVDERVPQLLAAQAKLEEAEQERLSARGAFDPVLNGATRVYAGADPRTLTDLSVSVQTAPGPELSAGWTRGVGEFPAYAGGDETSAAGQWWVGVQVPLLEGLLRGPERTSLLTSHLVAEVAELDLEAQHIELKRRATEAYARWVAAGAEREVDRQLLSLAEVRASALERQVNEGARARIDLVDNQRVVWERQNELVEATAKLEAAALSLSLWRRDRDGRPLVPAPDALPELGAQLQPAPSAVPDPAATPLARRWELAVRIARLELRQSENALWPEADLYARASHDPLGYDELYVGSALELAVPARKERGRRGAAAAALVRAEAERQAAIDQLEADISAARIALEAATVRYERARLAEQAADEVLSLEQRRLELGGADLFQLLVRESVAAQARRATVSAWSEHAVAAARYTALTAPAP